MIKEITIPAEPACVALKHERELKNIGTWRDPMKEKKRGKPVAGSVSDSGVRQQQRDEVVDQSPPGTASGANTTDVPKNDQVNPIQLRQGKEAKKDAESEQVDTDMYNVSGRSSKGDIPSD